jgi:alpha-beta hydrolase superfamily lysophospholipase
MPEEDPRALVLYVHGLGSHSGRMDHWAERFVENGIGFIAYDQHGHGKSTGKRGTPKHFRILVEDLRNTMNWLREHFPGKKIILYGHSLGGNVVINYVISETYTADALITTSPWLRLVHPPSAALIRILSPLTSILPLLTLSNGLNANDISRVPEEVKKYTDDPLVHDRISIGLFKSTFDAGFHALRNVYKINCPYLIMHGTADNITSHKASEQFVMNTSDRTRIKLWEGAFHELHHEEQREEVFRYIIEWLNEHHLV